MCLVIAQIQVMAFMTVFSVHPEALIRRQHIYTIATVMYTSCYKHAIIQIIHARDSLTYIQWSSTCWEGGTEILSLLVCLTPVEGTFVVTHDSGSD